MRFTAINNLRGGGRRRRVTGWLVGCVGALVLVANVQAPAAATPVSSPSFTTQACGLGGSTSWSCTDLSLQATADASLAPTACATLAGGCSSGPRLLAVSCSDPTAPAYGYCQLDGQTCRYYGTFGEKGPATPGYAETSHSFSGSTSAFTGYSQADTGVGLTPSSAAEAVATAGTASWVNDTRAATASSTVGTGIDWFGFGWDNAYVDIAIHYKGMGQLSWAVGAAGAASADYTVSMGYHQWKNQRTTDLGETVTATPKQETQSGGFGGSSSSPSPNGIQTVHVNFTSLDSVYAFLRLTTDAATNAFGAGFIVGGAAAISDFGGAAANGGVDTTSSGSTPRYVDYLYADWRFDRGVGC